MDKNKKNLPEQDRKNRFLITQIDEEYILFDTKRDVFFRMNRPAGRYVQAVLNPLADGTSSRPIARSLEGAKHEKFVTQLQEIGLITSSWCASFLSEDEQLEVSIQSPQISEIGKASELILQIAPPGSIAPSPG